MSTSQLDHAGSIPDIDLNTFRSSTALGWGGALGATLLYLTDWKAVVQYVPFVNKKFDHEIPE